MAHKFVITELDHTPIGAIEDAYERWYSTPESSLTQARVRLRLDDPMAKEITDRDGEVRLKIYDGIELPFMGQLTSADEVGPNYHRTVRRDRLVNSAHSLGTDTAGNEDVKSAVNAASQAARGLFEEVVSFTADSASLRQAYIKEAVRIRGAPVVQIELDPVDAGNPGLVCNFAGPLWDLQHRLFNKTTLDEAAVTDTNADIAWGLIAAANAELHTGIYQGTLLPTIETTQILGRWKPVAECLTEMANSKAFPFETPATWILNDDFTGGSGDVEGRTATAGGVWERYGSALDLQETGAHLRREEPSLDQAVWDVLSTSISGPVLVRSNVGFAPDAVLAPTDTYGFGAVARFGSTSAYFSAEIVDTSTGGNAPKFAVLKNGVIVDSTPIVLANPYINYSIVLAIDAAGRWAAWIFPATESNPVVPTLYGQDADLATGGALQNGKCGYYDKADVSAASYRDFDTFRAGAITLPLDWQGLGFKFVYVDGSPPTINFDVNAGVGTVRPEIVFEVGDGAPPISQQYTFNIDYFVGDTVTARGRYNGERFNGTVRIYNVEVTIDNQGAVTISPKLSPE